MSRNVVFCAACWKVIESKHRHDCVTCGCPNNAMVDGGQEKYVRYGAVQPELLVPMKTDEIEKYEALAGDYDKKNLLLQIFEASKLNKDSYGNQVLAMRGKVNRLYEPPDSAPLNIEEFTEILDEFTILSEKDNLKRLAGVNVDSKAAQMRHKIIKAYGQLLEAKK